MHEIIISSSQYDADNSKGACVQSLQYEQME